MASGRASLLKFPNEQPVLQGAGMAMLQRLDGPVHPIIFIGDGRGGKSFLASKTAGVENLFVSRNTAEPVTEGIDVATLPCVDGHLVLMDAEGGNNALAVSHVMVNVLATCAATLVVFVSSGTLTEESLQNLVATLAIRDLIHADAENAAPVQRLCMVVNKCTLQYNDGHLEQALAAQYDGPRAEVRQKIMQAFPEGRRQFISIPLQGLGADFEARVQQLHGAVHGASALELGGARLDGPQFANLVRSAFQAIQSTGQVEMPSVMRYVIFDGFLVPLVNRCVASYEAALPALEAHNAELHTLNPKARVTRDFDTACAHLNYARMKAEARADLVGRIDQIWDTLEQRNAVLLAEAQAAEERARAEAVRVVDSTTETREVHERSYEEEVGRSGRRYGIAGPRKAIKVTRHVYKIEARTRSLHGNGEITYTNWADTGSRSTK